MDTSKLTSQQRQIRQHIRNAFLISTVAEMEAAKANYKDNFSKSCIDEMIDACRKAGVDSHAKVPG